MSRTLTNQAHLFPVSGTEQTWTASTAVHSVIPYDLPSMLNNLKGYVDLCAGYCQSAADGLSSVAGAIPITLSSPFAGELFFAQVPTLVPRGARRMLWTAGLSVTNTAETLTITGETVYLSPVPYVGPGPATAFDSAVLPPGYASRTVATSVTGAYVRVSDTTTGMVSPPGWDQGQDRLAHLIFTITCETTGINPLVAAYLYDFTWWFLYE